MFQNVIFIYDYVYMQSIYKPQMSLNETILILNANISSSLFLQA